MVKLSIIEFVRLRSKAEELCNQSEQYKGEVKMKIAAVEKLRMEILDCSGHSGSITSIGDISEGQLKFKVSSACGCCKDHTDWVDIKLLIITDEEVRDYFVEYKRKLDEKRRKKQKEKDEIRQRKEFQELLKRGTLFRTTGTMNSFSFSIRGRSIT